MPILKRKRIELLFLGLSIFLLSKIADGALWTQTRDEYVKLHDAYVHTANKEFYSDILPRVDSSSPIDVTIGMEMYAIREFDAPSGALEVVGSVSMAWTDPIETLHVPTTFDSNTVNSILVNYKKIWTPVIVLLNSADDIQRIGDETYLARFNLASGAVTWKPRALLRTSCTPNVEFFPFDEHECEFIFSPWFQNSSKVRLLTPSGNWGLSNYKDNGIWKKDTTSSSVSLVDGYYYATFTLRFSRQPLYFVINVVFPVLLLSAVSGFLFLIPVGSGERVGFGITCFLSFIVLLQTMLQFFPEISDPMSLLCFYAIIMMILSGTLSIVNILLLKVHNKTTQTDPLPRLLVHFLETIKCIKCKRAMGNTDRKTSAGSETGVLRGSDFGSEGFVSGGSEDFTSRSEETVSGSEGSQTEKEVDWASVGKVLDMFFFAAFIGTQIGFTVIYLAPLFSKF